MSYLKSVSDEDLKAELRRREMSKSIKFIQSTDINDRLLRSTLNDYIENTVNGGGDDDDEHYIFECVLQTYYGMDVFERLNKFL